MLPRAIRTDHDFTTRRRIDLKLSVLHSGEKSGVQKEVTLADGFGRGDRSDPRSGGNAGEANESGHGGHHVVDTERRTLR